MTSQPTPSLAQLIIDLDAVAFNISLLAEIADPAEVMAIVKADGYNHGAADIAQTAMNHGAGQLGTATLREAVELRRAGVSHNGSPAPITAWMWDPSVDLQEVFDNTITVGIPSLEHAHTAIDCAKRWVENHSAQPTHLPQVGLMVDTGMSRSGVAPDQWEATVAELAAAEHAGWLQVDGVFSHLASADDGNQQAITDTQARRFDQAIESCRKAGLAIPRNHIANTPATLTRPDLHHEVVRPGVAVYGVDPVISNPEHTNPGLCPAMTMRAKVVTTRTVPAGESVSYGGTWTAPTDTRTAVVAAGYADGVPRSASGNMDVSIRGQRFQQIGRVCMDQIVVNLGPVGSQAADSVQPGDWVVIFGHDAENPDAPTAEDLAEAAGTIAYEILTLPRGTRMQRHVLPVSDQGDLAQDSGVLTAGTADDMRNIGRRLGEQLRAGTVVMLTGPLGAGKTTITQGIAEGLGVRGRVQSPTFTIVRTHKPGDSGIRLLHMDAYRLLGEDVMHSVEPGSLQSRDQVLDTLESLDIDADLADAVLVAEWGRGMVDLLSDQVLDVEITRVLGAEDIPDDGDDPRKVHWRWHSR